MPQKTYDVIVVGAGPAGTAAARACAEQGLSTLCIEEHGTIGYPVQCAGLLSTAAFAECRVSERSILHRVSGARVVSAGGSEFSFDAKKTRAVVVDRGMLDAEMAEAAAQAGSGFRLRTSFWNVRDNTLITRGVNGREEFPFRMLIAADGPRGMVARARGMVRPPVYLAGIQSETVMDTDPCCVTIYPDASPEFFGWAIPSGKGRARIGMCGGPGIQEHFEKFSADFPGPCISLVTGTLPLGIMPRTYGNRTLYVGDAGGFAKPTSGGGVYTGIRTARHAAAVAAECCAKNSFGDADLAAYERKWQEDIGAELALGFRLYKMRQQLSPADIDRLIRALDDPEIRDLIVREGDMDRPGALVKVLIKKPALLACLGPLLSAGWKSFFA